MAGSARKSSGVPTSSTPRPAVASISDGSSSFEATAAAGRAADSMERSRPTWASWPPRLMLSGNGTGIRPMYWQA